jgi:hypothetical protein
MLFSFQFDTYSIGTCLEAYKSQMCRCTSNWYLTSHFFWHLSVFRKLYCMHFCWHLLKIRHFKWPVRTKIESALQLSGVHIFSEPAQCFMSLSARCMWTDNEFLCGNLTRHRPKFSYPGDSACSCGPLTFPIRGIFEIVPLILDIRHVGRWTHVPFHIYFMNFVQRILYKENVREACSV